MKSALKEWMLLAIGVIVIAALIWGAMTERVTEIYHTIDQELANS